MSVSKKTSPKYIIIAGVLLVIIFSFIHTISEDYFSPKKTDQTAPQAIMENVIAIQTGANGYPTDRLISPKLVNYKLNNITYLTTPHYTLFSTSGAPWEITSDYGRAINGVDEIYLWQNVVIYQPADHSQPFSTMTSDNFTIYPKTKKGHTDAPVKLVQPNMVTTAIGANANLNTKQITLLSNIQTIYSNDSPVGKSHGNTKGQ